MKLTNSGGVNAPQKIYRYLRFFSRNRLDTSEVLVIFRSEILVVSSKMSFCRVTGVIIDGGPHSRQNGLHLSVYGSLAADLCLVFGLVRPGIFLRL